MASSVTTRATADPAPPPRSARPRRAPSAGWSPPVDATDVLESVAGADAVGIPSVGALVKAVLADALGMHLDLSGLWRRRQAAAILAHVGASGDAMPTVMMGDLNEWSRAAGCLRDFGASFRFADTGPSFHARRPIARLDRIMVSPELRIDACGVHQSPAARVASDHLPIWANLATQEGASVRRPSGD